MDVLNSSSSSSSNESDDYVFVRRKKIYKKRENYLEKLDEINFFQPFRITKNTFIILLDKIKYQIQPATRRGGSIQPTIQLLLTLRYFATGCMQKTVADFVGVSASSACRIISKVSDVIASLRPYYINMYNTRDDMEKSAEKFYAIARFPRIIGAIDCTLIKIDSPGGEDAEIYRSRKNFFALNVQTVSDSDLKIRDIVARWPGSTHDQTIFNNSTLKRRFEQGQFGKFMLVGDSGYQLKPYLMTKLLNTETPAQNLNNESIIRARNVVERQYGVWKRRFPILKLGMRLNIARVMSVIVATAVLHNKAIEENEDVLNDLLEIEDNNEIDDNNEEVDVQQENHNETGQIARQLLINEHFARL